MSDYKSQHGANNEDAASLSDERASDLRLLMRITANRRVPRAERNAAFRAFLALKEIIERSRREQL